MQSPSLLGCSPMKAVETTSVLLCRTRQAETLLLGNYLLPSHNKRVSRCQAGEGNGTPLQYSCLENPMDGGAW